MTSKQEAEMLETLKAMRQDTIEECAQVAETYRWSEPYIGIQDAIITAIRALKDKPCQ